MVFFMVIVLVEKADEPRQNFPFRNISQNFPSFKSNGSTAEYHHITWHVGQVNVTEISALS
jgi:hypothetical protein